MISVKTIIGKSIAVLSSDGLKLYEVIVEELNQHKIIVVDFEGLDQVTSAFLNASLGKIWMNFPNHVEAIRFQGISPSLKQRIDLVKDNALNQEKSQIHDEAVRAYLQEA